MKEITEADLEAYLDETIDSERAAEIEVAVKNDSSLLTRLSHINGRRDAGVHTLGEIWRRHQFCVPSREDLGSYLLGVLDDEKSDYIDFRLNILKCQFTIANLEDLKSQQAESDESVKTRRNEYLKSSAGYFREQD